MTLQIEEGKYYRNRLGHKIGPMERLGREDSPYSMSGYNPECRYAHTFTEGGRRVEGRCDPLDLVAEWADGPALDTLSLMAPDAPAEADDVMADIVNEAGRIVTGARRSTYGQPEDNFERIARFWNAYLENKGVRLTYADGSPWHLSASDVSPMMRLLKEARLCETPDHYDSHVDLVGYALTGARVNGAKKSK